MSSVWCNEIMQIFWWHRPLLSCLHSALSVGRSCPRSPLWGIHQPDPTRCLWGSFDSPIQLCGAPLGVPAHDELQRAEPWICLCQVRLICSRYRCHSPAPWSHAGAWLLSQCTPQHREKTPFYMGPASYHQARGPSTGRCKYCIIVRVNEIIDSISWVTFVSHPVSHDFHTRFVHLQLAVLKSEICPNTKSIGVRSFKESCHHPRLK